MILFFICILILFMLSFVINIKVTFTAVLKSDYVLDVDLFFIGKIKFNLFSSVKKQKSTEGIKKRKKNKKKLTPIEMYRIIKPDTKIFDISLLDINMQIGVDDAAATALVISAFYTIFGMLISFTNIHYNIKLKKIKMNLKPSYNQIVFNASILCIAKLKIAHIISALFKFYILNRIESE